jgi:hypothetical protein
MALFREGCHADALRECTQYCREYPEDANALLWLEYFSKVVEQLDSHWWYEREDRLYPMAMARLPKRLDYSQDDRLLICWQQDNKLQEMCRQMHLSVEKTDVAWQHLSVCAFGMAQLAFDDVEKATTEAIRLHATACDRTPERAATEVCHTIEDWRKVATVMAMLEIQARQQVLGGNFSTAHEMYKRLLDDLCIRLDHYRKEQRPSWSIVFDELKEDAKVFPQDDLAQLFYVAEALLDAFVTREDELTRAMQECDQKILKRDQEIQLLKKKGCLSRIFDAFHIWIGD